jgi:inner membrane transporter RhtA
VSSTRSRDAFVGAALIVAGAASIQWSAAIVEPAFRVLSPAAVSAWRFLFGALVLLALTRPPLHRWHKEQWRSALALGLAVAFMNQCFFQSIARIPLGAAVTIEFLGPLTVAVVGQRSRQHLAFAGLAALGVVFLGHPGGHLTTLGVLYGLGSGLGWAGYIFANKRVGVAAPGFGGLAVSMTVAALATTPFSMSSFSTLSAHPWLAGRLVLVASMSIVFGFALELQALRRLHAASVAVLMAIDPAIAFVLGFLVLGQRAVGWDLVGLVCVVVAGVGVTFDQRAPTPTVESKAPTN